MRMGDTCRLGWMVRVGCKVVRVGGEGERYM